MTPKSLAKAVLRRAAPDLYARLFAARANRHGRRVLEKFHVPEITERWVSQHGWVVSSGPFAGMKYVQQAAGSSILPKLIGTYERELHPWFELAEYETVVDIGCAEGYYAVGLALLMPRARVYAFDADPEAARLCRELAALNGVSARVSVEGLCSHERLRGVVDGRTLIVCDCEGCEADLLDPAKVPSLRRADLLVELHDAIRPGTTAHIREAFAGSHRVEVIEGSPRDSAEFPQLASLPETDRAIAISEFRGDPPRWAFLSVHSQNDPR